MSVVGLIIGLGLAPGVIRGTLVMVMGIGLALGCRSESSEADKTGPLIMVDGPGVLKAVDEVSASAAVVVNFWATWCHPCREEFPMFVQTGQSYRRRGVKLMFVSMDFREDQKAVVEFLEKQGADLPSYLRTGKDHEFITTVHSPWSGALPATVVYGPKRKLRYFWEGIVKEEQLTKALDTLVAEASFNRR